MAKQKQQQTDSEIAYEIESIIKEVKEKLRYEISDYREVIDAMQPLIAEIVDLYDIAIGFFYGKNHVKVNIIAERWTSKDNTVCYERQLILSYDRLSPTECRRLILDELKQLVPTCLLR